MKQDHYLDGLHAPEELHGPGQKKQRTARRIFRAAIELMRRDGFDGVSIEQICEEAGIARATFFQHFTSKGALLEVFSDIICQRLDEELAPDDLTAVERLELVADHMQRMIDDLGAVAPDLLAAFSAEGGHRFKVDDPSTGVVHRIKTIVETGQADGALSNRWLAEDIAISLVAAWVGISRRRLQREASSAGAGLRDVLRMVLEGIAAPE
ncbi:MAG: TetR/AcrR family transcriptional regulator [Parvularcula sp.]|jgi:AcrR family transcriptional regulator|nr:TetR/AcrR family transcriptional regulator [Parvularcula sp.]